MDYKYGWKSAAVFAAAALSLGACGQSALQSQMSQEQKSVTNAKQALWEQFTGQGDLATKSGDKAKAEACYKAAIRAARTLGESSPQAAACMSNLANFYYVQGDGAQADELYKKALALKEKALGMEHQDLARDLVGLGRIALSSNKYPEAQQYFKRAVTILQNASQPIPPDLEKDCLEAARKAGAKP
jgi:tetratricopeptide (TPR) repeat protein